MDKELKKIFNLKDKLVSDFSEFEKRLNGDSVREIHSLRKEAKEYFENTGFPTRKMEDWKYTNTSLITGYNFEPAYKNSDEIFDRNKIKEFFIPSLDAYYVTLINGKFRNELSFIDGNIKGLKTGSLDEAIKTKDENLIKHLGKYADFRKDGFTALNTAFMLDGGYLYLPGETILDKPFVLLNISAAHTYNILSLPRNLIVVGKSASAEIIEIYFSTGENNCLTNSVTEIFTDDNSEINYYKVLNDSKNNFHIGTTQIQTEKNSRFNIHTVTWEGGITRNNLNVKLNGEGGECIMKGLYLLSGNQHADNHTFVDHAVPRCHSDEHYKGILDGNSTGIFSGRILVRKDAQKTNAYQSNNNIVLTKTANVNSKPQLEIYADDVKCSHGATTGQLNPDELFYLRSRGIGEKESKNILLYAFAYEVIDNIKNEKLKNYLNDLLQKKISINIH